MEEGLSSQTHSITVVYLPYSRGGLDHSDSYAVCVQLGPENRFADQRRSRNALERSLGGRAIIHCAHDGLDGLVFNFSKLSGVVRTICAR